MDSIRCASTNVTAFAPHAHKQYEILFFRYGTGTVTIDGTTYPYTAGSVALVPPGATHSSVSDGEVERIYVQGDFSAELPSAAPAVFQDDAEGRTLIELIHHNRFSNTNYLQALCHAYALFIAGHLAQDSAIHRAVRKISQAIFDQYNDSQCDVTAILADSGYAVDYIRARFKQVTGRTPHEQLTELRIRHACFLLEMYHRALPLAEIAERCGYTDYVHFSKTFKAVTGVSPREYLKENC